MPDFTKGKWEMKFEYDYDDNPPAYKIFSTFDTKYGVMEETIGYAYEENDARLIANAPDMYRILCNIRKWCEDHIFVKEFEQDIQNVLEAIEGMEGGEA